MGNAGFMAKSRYPRRGHRIAPAALRELLETPVPAKYHRSPADAGLRLCDLNESAWERFDETTCRALADEVVRAAGRTVRMPMSIGDRHIPPIPSGMKLTDLSLEVRTFNCLVSAGIHERPQDLGALTIETILGLRGFGVKCLVDLLTALEFAIEHPEARRALQSEETAPSRGPRITGRYPRQGFRLAPRTLQEILIDYIPVKLVKDTPVKGLRLCDLGEHVWESLDRETIEKLAEMMVARVTVSGYSRVVQHRRLPSPPKGMRLDDLRLENRTYNCLRKEGFEKRPESLSRHTVGQLLGMKAFGARCLVDLLSSLETLVDRQGKLDVKLTAEATLLGEIPEAPQIHFSDPRLGKVLRATDSSANTIGELVDHVVQRQLDPPDPMRLYEQVCDVRRRVKALMELSLEEELMQVFSPGSGGRDRQIVAEYYGWDGNGRHTLDELGKTYDLCRERIRQICVRAIKRNRGARIFTPVLDRALAFLAERLPCSATRLKEEFDAQGFSRCGLPLETVGEAARFLRRQPLFSVVVVGESRLAVLSECAACPRIILQVAKRNVLSYGATTINDVASEVSQQVAQKVSPELILATLRTLGGFRWLDERRGWFQLNSPPQYGLPNMVEKVLSVTGHIDVHRLRAAVARYRRTKRDVPPSRVLLEFCRKLPNTRVEGTVVIADPPRDWREVLAGVEAGMVEVLKEHGPVMERGVFEERCIAGGMNRFSFNAIVMCSPVIQQYGRSVYGLLGTKVDHRTVAALAARKTAATPAKVLRQFGQTAGGEVFLAYRLSKAAISGGVITVPAAMKQHVQGRFAIRTRDGEEAGTLVSKNGCAWGLGPVLRGRDVNPGEQLLILFDPKAQEAVVYIGEEVAEAPLGVE